MPQIASLHVLHKTIFPLLALFVFTSVLNAQSQDKVAEVTTVDFRGRSLDEAIMACVKITNNDYVAVLIKGQDQKLINHVTGEMKALIHRGYNRVGIVLGDSEPDEKGSVVGVFASGTIYAVIKEADEDLLLDWKIYNLVRDAYEEFVLPKTGKVK
jgi:hypothetical protein